MLSPMAHAHPKLHHASCLEICQVTVDPNNFFTRSGIKTQHITSAKPQQWFCFQNQINYVWDTLSQNIFYSYTKNSLFSGWPNQYIGNSQPALNSQLEDSEVSRGARINECSASTDSIAQQTCDRCTVIVFYKILKSFCEILWSRKHSLHTENIILLRRLDWCIS